MIIQNNAKNAEETVKPNNLIEHNELSVFEFDDNFKGLSGYSKPGWYFWNSSHCDYLSGPFETSEKAEAAQDIYFAGI